MRRPCRVLKALVMLLLVTGTMADAISQARKRAEREQAEATVKAQQARRSVGRGGWRFLQSVATAPPHMDTPTLATFT